MEHKCSTCWFLHRSFHSQETISLCGCLCENIKSPHAVVSPNMSCDLWMDVTKPFGIEVKF